MIAIIGWAYLVCVVFVVIAIIATWPAVRVAAVRWHASDRRLRETLTRGQAVALLVIAAVVFAPYTVALVWKHTAKK